LVRREDTMSNKSNKPRSVRLTLEVLEARLVPSAGDVLTYHNDFARTGANTNETILNRTNVSNLNLFGQRAYQKVDGQVYAQPLYIGGLVMPDGKAHNVVFVATENDSVYAFDADAPTMTAPLWHTSLLSGSQIPFQSNYDSTLKCGVGSTTLNIAVIQDRVGITGTPVIDRTSNTLYVVAATQAVQPTGTDYVYTLHALDVTTGADRSAVMADTFSTNPGFPGDFTFKDPTPKVPGSGGGSMNGWIYFNATREGQRPGLALDY